MTVAVRSATLDDIDAALALDEAVAVEGRWIAAEAPVDRIKRRAVFESDLQRDDANLFVADDGDAIVGLLGIEVSSYGVAEFGMMVAADRRGQGIGNALLASAVEWARSAGAHKLALEVWPHNEAAIALYRRFGFEEEGRLRRHYLRRSGELWDVVVMGLVLA